MFKKVLMLVLGLMVVSCATHKPVPVREIPLEDFFKNSLYRSFRLSPDGKKLAVLRPYKDRMNIFVRDTQAADKDDWKQLTTVTDRDIANIFWKGHDHILYVRDFGGDENYHVFSTNIHSAKSRDLTPYKNTRVGVLDTLDGQSDSEIFISMNKRDKRVFDVYRLNVSTGKLKLIEKNPGNITGWVLDHNGQIRYAISTDGVNKTLSYRKSNKDKFKPLKTFSFKEAFSPVFFDENSENVYVISNIGRNTSAAVLVKPESLEEIKLVYQNENYDLNDLNYSKKTKKLIAVGYVDWKQRKKLFSEKYEDIFEALEDKLGDKEISLTSSDDEEELFVVYAGSDRSKGMYYIYDYKTKMLSELANPSPWIKEEEMAEMKPISYTTRDGLKVEGYLTLPRGKKAGALPVIVNPHGGPWARDYWGYNSEIQFLANRGYAVLQMNFRGSTGYGKKFWEASFKQWGRTMQDDITDGVKWIVDEGIADPKRICIYGGSYGGYATLAGLTYTPDLYKCGVDYVGVSNLLTFMQTIPPYWKPMLEMLYEMVGNPTTKEGKQMLMDASPYFNAQKITAPLFVAQGAKDPRVNKAESDQIVSALEKRGVDVKYLVKENEGHGFHNQENRFEFYSEMEKFLTNHL